MSHLYRVRFSGPGVGLIEHWPLQKVSQVQFDPSKGLRCCATTPSTLISASPSAVAARRRVCFMIDMVADVVVASTIYFEDFVFMNASQVM